MTTVKGDWDWVVSRLDLTEIFSDLHPPLTYIHWKRLKRFHRGHARRLLYSNTRHRHACQDQAVRICCMAVGLKYPVISYARQLTKRPCQCTLSGEVGQALNHPWSKPVVLEPTIPCVFVCCLQVSRQLCQIKYSFDWKYINVSTDF